MKDYPLRISEMDKDCIKKYEDLMGVQFDTYEQYKQLDSFLDFIILDIDTKEEFSTYFIWICAYRDTLGMPEKDDNLCEMLFPAAWLSDYIKKEFQNSLEEWLNIYTADSVDAVISAARESGVPIITK